MDFAGFCIIQSQYCAGDRLEISYSGCQDLNDGQRYCYDNPFVGVSRSNAMVIGELCYFSSHQFSDNNI